MPKNYTLIEHTADIGIKIKGKNLKEVFKNSALAMFDIMAEQRTEKITVKLKSDNLEELFVNWLNELLSLSAAKELIFTNIKIKRLGKNILEAEVTGCGAKNYKFNTEIKAATYHELEIRRAKSGWQARVILDV